MIIKIERVQDRIWLSAPYSAHNTALAKSVVGASWRNREKVWTYPLDLVVCRDLRRVFGSQLDIGPHLTAWARAEIARHEALKPLLTAKDTDGLERVEKHAPLIWAAMNDGQHEYQKPVALYCALARRAQNASQPGLGKTLETLAAIVEADVRGLILVAAPKTSLRTVWEPEVKRWLPGVPVFACTGSKSRREATLSDAQRTWQSGNHNLVFVIVNPEMLRTSSVEECNDCGWKEHNHKQVGDVTQHIEREHRTIKFYTHEYPQLFEQEWTGFIVDETHRYILNVNLRTARVTQTGTGAMLIRLSPDHLKLALSGTPWKGKPKNAWSVAHWLHGDVGLNASFWNWANRMLHVGDNGFGKVLGGVRDEQAFNEWVDTFMIRHTKAEMASFLPPKSYGGTRLDPADPSSPVGVWLDMEGKQAAAYKSMMDSAAAALDGGTLTATGVLAEMTRLKQFANGYGTLVPGREPGTKKFLPAMPSNKFDALVEMLEERGITGVDETEEGDSKVVVASQFTETIDLFVAELERKGIRCFKLTGRVSDKERDAAVKRFQQPGGPRVFFINTMAGGVSVTLDAADDLIFIDETFVPDDQEQVEDRTHRTSRVHNVTIYYMRTRGTIDESIARNNIEKDDIQKRLLDGKRGVEFARRILKGE